MGLEAKPGRGRGRPFDRGRLADHLLRVVRHGGGPGSFALRRGHRLFPCRTLAVGGEIADISTNAGVFRVGAVFFGLLLALVLANTVIAGRGNDTYVGHWAQAWARRYPLFALAISFFFGALIGHFFWDSWCPITGP